MAAVSVKRVLPGCSTIQTNGGRYGALVGRNISNASRDTRISYYPLHQVYCVPWVWLLEYDPCKAPVSFTIRPYCRFSVQCAVTPS